MTLIKSYLTKNPCYQANVDRIDSRYTTFQSRGPLGLMLHSVGCSQPSAMVFVNRWNSPTYNNACVHGFIDARSGIVYQTLPWNFRGWHGGGSSNNTHVGVEMCESEYIKYVSSTSFKILDKEKAQQQCKNAYVAAVELFADICKQYNLDPFTAILSHHEGYLKGVATNHGDPEHYWRGLGMPYTMDGFRQDVYDVMNGGICMSKDELLTLLASQTDTLSTAFEQALTAAVNRLTEANADQIAAAIEKANGKYIAEIDDIPWEGVRKNMRELLDEEAINGGTAYDVNPNDVNLPLNFVRVLAVAKLHTDIKMKQLQEGSAE